jgi:ubiquinone biosynthesis protein COQ4
VSAPGQQLIAPTCVRSFSILDRPAPKYEGHVPLTRTEKAVLAVGSAVITLFDPRRGG